MFSIYEFDIVICDNLMQKYSPQEQSQMTLNKTDERLQHKKDYKQQQPFNIQLFPKQKQEKNDLLQLHLKEIMAKRDDVQKQVDQYWHQMKESQKKGLMEQCDKARNMWSIQFEKIKEFNRIIRNTNNSCRIICQRIRHIRSRQQILKKDNIIVPTYQKQMILYGNYNKQLELLSLIKNLIRLTLFPTFHCLSIYDLNKFISIIEACDIIDIMTLYLELSKVNGISPNSYVYVEGSQAGPLISRKLSTQNFQIKCNKNDVLQLAIYDHNFKNIEESQKIGDAIISAGRFIRENKTNPDLYNREKAIKYEINIYNAEEMAVGSVVFQVRYNAGLLYMGEKFGNYETMPVKQPVKLYAGVCQTRNLFNYFDSGYENKPCHTYESAYRDQTWGEN